MRTNLIVLLSALVPFILLLCLTPGVFGAFIFLGVFSFFMYVNLLISAKVNAQLGGDTGMKENSFHRFLFILLFSISIGVVLAV